MKIFDEIESGVQSYARSFPNLFHRAKGEFMYDKEGNEYLDFLAGAGTLNYGHNNDTFKKALLEYIENDGITHGLDVYCPVLHNGTFDASAPEWLQGLVVWKANPLVIDRLTTPAASGPDHPNAYDEPEHAGRT